METLIHTHLQVGCTLEYWDADCASFVALERFHVSESSTAEITVSCPTPSRRWKVTIKEVEWVDEEEGELFISKLAISVVAATCTIHQGSRSR